MRVAPRRLPIRIEWDFVISGGLWSSSPVDRTPSQVWLPSLESPTGSVESLVFRLDPPSHGDEANFRERRCTGRCFSVYCATCRPGLWSMETLTLMSLHVDPLHCILA